MTKQEIALELTLAWIDAEKSGDRSPEPEEITSTFNKIFDAIKAEIPGGFPTAENFAEWMKKAQAEAAEKAGK